MKKRVKLSRPIRSRSHGDKWSLRRLSFYRPDVGFSFSVFVIRSEERLLSPPFIA